MEPVTIVAQDNADVLVGSSSIYRGHDRTPQPSKVSTIAEVARRQILNAGSLGSPVHRSPRLSCLPPPQPPEDTLETLDESSVDEFNSVNDVALRLSREDTPENDFLPDEPSIVLANRIMRAHDNPSPPPQYFAHTDTDYVLGKDGQFPLLDVSAPPCPFRAINLLERLNQLSAPPFDSSSRTCTPDSADQPVKGFGDSERRNTTPPTLSAIPAPIPGTQIDILPSADATNIPSAPSLLKDILWPSSQHTSEPVNQDDTGNNSNLSQCISGAGQATTAISPTENEASGVPPTLASVSSPEVDTHSASYGCAEPFSHPQTLPSRGKGEGSSSEPETRDPGCKNDNGAETHTLGGGCSSSSKERQVSPTGGSLHDRLQSLSPSSTEMLTGLFSQPVSSIEHILADSMRATDPPTTPTRITTSPLLRPDFSQTTVQRSVTAPLPVRPNDCLKRSTSPLKFSSNTDDVTRTPAQRVPIQTALSFGIPSTQRTIHLASGLDQSNTGRLSTIRAPVFSRPALDDPSRSPAKRVPVMHSVVSPRREEVQLSPMRLILRARSTSTESRPAKSLLTRSQSIEPSATTSNPEDGNKTKESIFSTFPIASRSGSKLPFPLAPSQMSHSDLPSSIPEETEPVTTEKIESRAALGRAPARAAKSQFKQPSTSSRIPRIGNKPYIRPSSKNGKSIVGTTVTTTSTTAPAFRLASKGDRAGHSNSNEMATQPVDTRLSGTLKRKRGEEARTVSSSRPVIIRQVVPGMLSGKYAPKPSQPVPPTQLRYEPTEPSPVKPTQPMKFRKVVDGMLSARYAPPKPNVTQTQPLDSDPAPPSPLSDIPSSSDQESLKKEPSSLQTAQNHGSDRSASSPTPRNFTTVDTGTHHYFPQDANSEEVSRRPRRTSRPRKPAQQQYVLDVFSADATTRPPPTRRKPHTRGDGDGFMGMSTTALRALTTSNTTKNQQTVAVFATEIIQKEGLRPESPTVKMKTILQKKRDERDMRRQERAERRARMMEGSEASDTEGNFGLHDQEDRDENESGVPRKHRRGPGDEEDYETPERPERNVDSLRFDGVPSTDKVDKPTKQVKWHRGLSTAIYLDDLAPKRRPKDVPVIKGCLAPTSKSLPLDHLGNVADIEHRPLLELVAEHVVVKKYLYDNDIESEPIPQKVTRSKSKKSKG